MIGDWNAKVGSQETPGVTGRFGLGMQNESRAKTNGVLPRKCTGHSKHPLPTTQDSTPGHHQMVNTKIRLIIFLQPKMEKLYTVNKNKIGT